MGTPVRVAPSAQMFPGSHPLTSAGARAENPCVKQGLVLQQGFCTLLNPPNPLISIIGDFIIIFLRRLGLSKSPKVKLFKERNSIPLYP